MVTGSPFIPAAHASPAQPSTDTHHDSNTATPAAQPSLEQKIDTAVAQSAQIVNAFSPSIARALEAGAEVEPLISGMVQLFISIFRHHVTKPSPAQ
jgi:hypothetical protein